MRSPDGRFVAGVYAMCVLLTVNDAFAQAPDPATPAPAAPAAAPGPDAAAPRLDAMEPPAQPVETESAPPAQAPAETPAPTAAPALRPDGSGAAACVIGAHDGIADADAATSTALVCEALIDAGAKVGARPISEAQAADYTAAYRVDMRPLGKLIVLQVGFESPIGTRLRGRTLQLANLEEVPVAAVRLADALKNDKPLESTASVSTLVGQETRKYDKEYGETLFGFGLFGMAIPSETWAGYGAFGRIYYEATRYAVGVDLRVGGSGENDGDAHMVGISVGGRYFLNAGDIAPFVGGGAGILWLGVSNSYTAPGDPLYGGEYEEFSSQDGSGLAPYAEVGVEFLRFHGSRFDLLLRADVPIFELEDAGRDEYALPISLLASYSID